MTNTAPNTAAAPNTAPEQGSFAEAVAWVRSGDYDAEALDERLYRLANGDVIGDRDLDYHCDEGHFDCAVHIDGACTGRLVAERVTHLETRLMRLASA